MKEHDDFEKKYASVASAELSEEELMDLAEHAQQCAECQKRIVAVTQTLLSRTVKRTPVPKGMEERFLSRAVAEGIHPGKSRQINGGLLHVSGVLATTVLLFLSAVIGFSRLGHVHVVTPLQIAAVSEVPPTAASGGGPRAISPPRFISAAAVTRHQRKGPGLSVGQRRNDSDARGLSGARVASSPIFDAGETTPSPSVLPAFHFAALGQQKSHEASLDIAELPENYPRTLSHAFRYDPAASRFSEQVSYAYQNVNWYQRWLRMYGSPHENQTSLFQ